MVRPLTSTCGTKTRSGLSPSIWLAYDTTAAFFGLLAIVFAAHIPP